MVWVGTCTTLTLESTATRSRTRAVVWTPTPSPTHSAAVHTAKIRGCRMVWVGTCTTITLESTATRSQTRAVVWTPTPSPTHSAAWGGEASQKSKSVCEMACYIPHNLYRGFQQILALESFKEVWDRRWYEWIYHIMESYWNFRWKTIYFVFFEKLVYIFCLSYSCVYFILLY